MLEISDLFNSEVLKKILLDDKSNVRIVDTMISDVQYVLHESRFKDIEDFTNRKRQIFINSTNAQIERVIYSVHYFDQIQINDYNISNIQVNKINETKLQNDFNQITENLEKIIYQPHIRPSFKIGDTIPQFQSKLYPSDKLVDINYDNKIVILDFWYTACMPCVKIIPYLNLLYEKYKKVVEFYAVNLSEDDYQNKIQVDKFNERTPIHYSIVFGDGQLIDSLKIVAFPSLYIIKNNKLEYIHIGYNHDEDLYSEIDSVLMKLLQ